MQKAIDSYGVRIPSAVEGSEDSGPHRCLDFERHLRPFCCWRSSAGTFGKSFFLLKSLKPLKKLKEIE